MNEDFPPARTNEAPGMKVSNVPSLTMNEDFSAVRTDEALGMKVSNVPSLTMNEEFSVVRTNEALGSKVSNVPSLTMNEDFSAVRTNEALGSKVSNMHSATINEEFYWPSDTRNNTPDETASTLNELLDSILFSEKHKFKRVWRLLCEESIKSIDQIEKSLSEIRIGNPTSKTAQPLSQVLTEAFSPDYAFRLNRMIKEKGELEIPALYSRDSKELLKPGTQIEVGKTQKLRLSSGRSFDVFVPERLQVSSLSGKQNVPSIVALHGVIRSDATHRMRDTTGLNLIAERNGIVVIYPDAVPQGLWPPVKGWSVPGKENILPTNPEVNDLEDIEKMVQYVRENVVPIAPKIGVIGHSDGGRMAQVYATEKPEQVAFLVAWNSTWMKNDPPPYRGVPARIILSDEDETLPMSGGEGRNTRILDSLYSTTVKDSRPMMIPQVWSKANQCSGKIYSTQKNDVTHKIYRSCRQPLQLDIMHGQGHSIGDWHNVVNNIWSPADTTSNTTYEIVKTMLPYLLGKTNS